MKNILIIPALIFSFYCHADLIVYTLKISDTVTGNGSVQKIAGGGYVILDTDDGSISEVVSIPKLHRFSTEFPENTFNYVDGGSKNYTVFLVTPSTGTGFTTAKGITSSIFSGIDTWSLPKTLTLSGSAFLSGVFSQGTGTLVFDSKNTQIVNLDGDNSAAAVTYFSNLLIAKGYTSL